MNHRSASENFERLRRLASGSGIDLLSSVRIRGEDRASFHEAIREPVAPLDHAVVIGMRLSKPVLETVKRAPTWTYYHHYRTVNSALDLAAFHLTSECMRMGYTALAVPASQILDWDRLRGHLSHRRMAERAGLGWRGRNNLLVNPTYGSQVRYATILTDVPLPEQRTDGRGDCGTCKQCISVCPVGAIHESPADFEPDKCTAQLRRFSKQEKLNSLICGLCVRACPGRLQDAAGRGGDRR